MEGTYYSCPPGKRPINFLFSVYDTRHLLLMTTICILFIFFYQQFMRESVGRKYFAIRDGRIVNDDLTVSEVLSKEELSRTDLGIATNVDVLE